MTKKISSGKKIPYKVLPGITVKYDGEYHGPDTVIHMPKEVGDKMSNCVAPCVSAAETTLQPAGGSNTGKTQGSENSSAGNPANPQGNTENVKPEDPQRVQSRIVEAIIDMDTEDPERKKKNFWTKGGELPELKELERRIGWPVTDAERKDAFEQFKTLKA